MTKKIIKALALFGLFFSGFVGYAPGGYLSRLLYSRQSGLFKDQKKTLAAKI